MSLETLSPELLFSIFAHLDHASLFNLLLVSKHVHPIAHEELWSSLGFTGNPKSKDAGCRFLRPQSCVRIMSMHYASSSPNLGYRHTKTLGIRAKPVLGDKDLAEMLVAVMNYGGLQPRRLVLDLQLEERITHSREYRVNPTIDFTRDLWPSINAYSTSSLSLSLSGSLRVIGDFLRAFAPNTGDKVTSLTLTVAGEDYFEDPNDMVDALTAVFSQTTNLKHLTLTFTTHPYYHDEEDGYEQDEIIWPISRCARSLALLQRKFSALTKLQSLEITGLCIHPSFFLQPPKSLTSLRLNCITTPLWWIKFASFNFDTNLKNLTFEYQPGETYWRDIPAEMNHGITIPQKYKPFKTDFIIPPIPSLTLTTFKGRAPPFGPSNLLESIANTTNTDFEFKQDWSDETPPEIAKCLQLIRNSVASELARMKKTIIFPTGSAPIWWRPGL
ncbi:hypothetical protein TWF481_004948 [Arthrobotrys musiformis]|uniref:F-box domain-containing protein n=1 Tax=Arthrobotrys musiformis TaxID=47236 RepID=A0AAV9WMM9_9PEZI